MVEADGGFGSRPGLIHVQQAPHPGVPSAATDEFGNEDALDEVTCQTVDLIN